MARASSFWASFHLRFCSSALESDSVHSSSYSLTGSMTLPRREAHGGLLATAASAAPCPNVARMVSTSHFDRRRAATIPTRGLSSRNASMQDGGGGRLPRWTRWSRPPPSWRIPLERVQGQSECETLTLPLRAAAWQLGNGRLLHGWPY